MSQLGAPALNSSIGLRGVTECCRTAWGCMRGRGEPYNPSELICRLIKPYLPSVPLCGQILDSIYAKTTHTNPAR
jgi:hypothetical protein